MEWLYNKNGQAELFTYDDRLISKTGKNLAWIYNGNIYNIKNGKHIGWYENGVLYDSKNKALAFKLNYTGYLHTTRNWWNSWNTRYTWHTGRPGFSGTPGRPGYGGWSSSNIEDYFEV